MPRQKRLYWSSLGIFRAPLVEREGRIGDDHIELHELVVFDQRGAVERVAPLDAGGILGVQEHVHAGQGPGAPLTSWP